MSTRAAQIVTAKTILATSLWAASIALAITGTIYNNVPMMFWSILVGLGAAIVTGWIVAECAVRKERINIEHLVDGMLARAQERANLPRINN